MRLWADLLAAFGLIGLAWAALQFLAWWILTGG